MQTHALLPISIVGTATCAAAVLVAASMTWTAPEAPHTVAFPPVRIIPLEDGLLDVDADGAPASEVMEFIANAAGLSLVIDGDSADQAIRMHAPAVTPLLALRAAGAAVGLGLDRDSRGVRMAPHAVLEAEQQAMRNSCGVTIKIRRVPVPHAREIAAAWNTLVPPGRLRVNAENDQSAIIEAMWEDMDRLEQLVTQLGARTSDPLMFRDVLRIVPPLPVAPACPTQSSGALTTESEAGALLMDTARKHKTGLVVGCRGLLRVPGAFAGANADDVVRYAAMDTVNVQNPEGQGFLPVALDREAPELLALREPPPPVEVEHLMFFRSSDPETRAVALQQLGLGATAALPELGYVAVRATSKTLEGALQTGRWLEMRAQRGHKGFELKTLKMSAE